MFVLKKESAQKVKNVCHSEW